MRITLLPRFDGIEGMHQHIAHCAAETSREDSVWIWWAVVFMIDVDYARDGRSWVFGIRLKIFCRPSQGAVIVLRLMISIVADEGSR